MKRNGADQLGSDRTIAAWTIADRTGADWTGAKPTGADRIGAEPTGATGPETERHVDLITHRRYCRSGFGETLI